MVPRCMVMLADTQRHIGGVDAGPEHGERLDPRSHAHILRAQWQDGAQADGVERQRPAVIVR